MTLFSSRQVCGNWEGHIARKRSVLLFGWCVAEKMLIACYLWSILYEHGTGIYCNIWIFFTWQILYAKRQALKSWLQWVTFILHKLLHTIIYILCTEIMTSKCMSNNQYLFHTGCIQPHTYILRWNCDFNEKCSFHTNCCI